MTSQKNAKNSQWRNGLQRNIKSKRTDNNMQETQLIQEVRALNETIREMNMRLDAFLVREEEATPEELRAIERGKKEIREGKFITLDELKKKHGWK